MKSNYVISTLKSFKKKETELFRQFLEAKYINKNEHYLPFYNLLIKKISKHNSSELNPDEISVLLSPGKKLSPVQLRLQLSGFKKLLEDFLVFQHFRTKKSLRDSILLNTLRQKNLKGNFRKTLNKVSRDKSDAAGSKSIVDPVFETYLLHKEAYEFEHSVTRFTKDKVAPLVASLDQYYLLENIKLACHDWVNVKESEDRSFFKSRINALLKNHAADDHEDSAIFSFHLTIYNILYNHHKVDFRTVLDEFYALESKFNERDRKHLYIVLINYCAFRYNKGDREFAELVLSLYLRGLGNKNLLVGNRLSPYTYKNIIFIYLNLFDFDNAMGFMKKYTAHLPPDIRENSYQFNLASTLFRKGDYDQALEIMSKTRFNDVYDDLSSRRMLVRIYFEREEWSALHSLLDSFEIHLKRKKNLGIHKELFNNLIRYTRKTLAAMDGDKNNVHRLLKELSAVAPFPEKPWLEGKLAAML